MKAPQKILWPWESMQYTFRIYTLMLDMEGQLTLHMWKAREGFCTSARPLRVANSLEVKFHS